jgi:hypothetical protein
MDPEGASELRRRFVSLRAGGVLDSGASADIDEFQLDAVLVYRTLVLRRSPAASRPPSVYQPVWIGRYYEVWQRPESGSPEIAEHLSLGDRFHAAAVPPCSQVLGLARIAGPNGRLATVFRPANAALELTGSAAPGQLGPYGEDSGALYLRNAQTFQLALRTPVAGRYEIGVDGSFLGRLELAVNGRAVGDARHELNWPSQYEPLATVRLQKAQNALTLRYDGPDLHPGSSGGPPFGLGPLVAGRTDRNLAVTYVSPSAARSLCGRSLDWVEVLRP